MPMNSVPSPQELALMAGLDVSANGDVIPPTDEPTNKGPEATNKGPEANTKPEDIEVPDVSAITAQLAEVQASLATSTESLTAANARIAELEAAATAATEAHAAALAEAQTALAGANATIEALTPAVRNAVKGLAVPLNKTVAHDTLSGQELATAYTELSAAYIEHFKKNKQTKTTAVVDDKDKPPVQKPAAFTMLGIAAASLK